MIIDALPSNDWARESFPLLSLFMSPARPIQSPLNLCSVASFLALNLRPTVQLIWVCYKKVDALSASLSSMSPTCHVSLAATTAARAEPESEQRPTAAPPVPRSLPEGDA